MARMNQAAGVTGRPRARKPDLHTAAVAAAYEDGLAEWATRRGWLDAKGRPLVHTAKQRRMIERAMDAEARN